MKLTVINRKKIPMYVEDVKGFDVMGNIIRIFFHNENDSRSAFQRIRDFGLRCCHAGINAPDGPMVMTSGINHQDFTLKFN